MAMTFHGAAAAVVLLVGAGAGCVSPPGRTGAVTSSQTARDRGPDHRDDAESGAALDARARAHAHFATSVIYDLNDERGLALEEMARAAQANPAEEELVLDVTRRLLRRKKAERAVEILTIATARPEATGAVFAQLGAAYAQLDRNDVAVEANRAAIRKSPRSLAGYQNLFALQMREKQLPEAFKVLEAAIRQPGTDAPFLIDLAELYVDYGRQVPGEKSAAHKQALSALTRADQLNPTNASVQFRLADGYFLLGDNDRAAAAYLELLKHCADEPTLRDNLRGRLVKLYLGGHDKARAAEQLEALVKENPTNPQMQFLLGTLAFDESRLSDAEDCFRKAILLSPDLEPVYYELANVELARNNPQEALQTLARARQRFVAAYLYEFLSALANIHLKHYATAVNHFTAAEIIARNSQPERLNDLFYFQFGAAAERNGDYQQAERHFLKCLELQPDSAEALNYLGYMWTERGEKLDPARELIEKAVKLEPRSAAYLDSMGWVLFKLDQPKEALPYMLQAVEHSEKPDATIYDHLGDIYAALHEPEKARAAWTNSLAVEPNERVRQKLDAVPAR